ncbi:MAG: AAA family ATPase, partial [Streptosporangiaceae bacterium]
MEGSPPERDVLLTTKLQVPRSRPGLVPRRRLADRLEEGLNRGLVLVAAPAGYGKSVLLSEWVRGMTEPVAWLSLDGGDNDPVRFWRHVLAALDMVRPGIAERVSPLAGPPAPPAYDALVSALINEVAAEPGQPDVLLVLDDYHLISSDSVQESVRFLLAHRPPQLRVVLASRSDPPLGLARSRGRGELGEVRAADLRFNLDEAAELLRQVSADLDLSIATALAERTEGWAVGLQLAALSLRTLQRSYAAQLRGDAAATAALTREAMEQLGENELMLSSAVQGFLAMAEWLHGRLATAAEAFESSIGWWRREGQVTTTAWGYYCLARLHRGQGRLDTAAATFERALEAAGQPGQRPRPAAGPALVGLGEVAYQRDDLDRALEYVNQGITLCRQFVHTPPLAAGLVTLAWIRQAAGDRRGARDAMTEAESFSPGPAGLLNPVPAQR